MYRIVIFDERPNGGLKGMETLISERVANGYTLMQATNVSTYGWVFKREAMPDDARKNGEKSGKPMPPVEH